MLDRGEASDDGTAKLQRGVAHDVVAALCWGSRADTFGSVKEYRPELFCWDYAIGTFLAPLVYAYTIGRDGQDRPGFLASPTQSNIDWAILAGVIFDLADLLLVAYLALMFIFYVVAILLVARANTSASLLALRTE